MNKCIINWHFKLSVNIFDNVKKVLTTITSSVCQQFKYVTFMYLVVDVLAVILFCSLKPSRGNLSSQISWHLRRILTSCTIMYKPSKEAKWALHTLTQSNYSSTYLLYFSNLVMSLYVQVANYIPQLAKFRHDLWGVSLCTVDGQRWENV